MSCGQYSRAGTIRRAGTNRGNTVCLFYTQVFYSLFDHVYAVRRLAQAIYSLTHLCNAVSGTGNALCGHQAKLANVHVLLCRVISQLGGR